MRTSILLLISLLAFACQELGTGQPSTEGWAIYCLRDGSITAYDASGQPLDALVLADTAFMTTTDISAYYWSTHTFEPSAQLEARLTAMRDSRGSVFGIPFVVQVGSDRIYMGAFWYAYSSVAPTFPHIELISNPHQIQPSWEPGGTDLRNDIRIHDSLKRAGVLVE
jgi:hypothetical protein